MVNKDYDKRSLTRNWRWELIRRMNCDVVCADCRQVRSGVGWLDGLEGRGDIAVAGHVGSSQLLDRRHATAATAHGPPTIDKLQQLFHAPFAQPLALRPALCPALRFVQSRERGMLWRIHTARRDELDRRVVVLRVGRCELAVRPGHARQHSRPFGVGQQLTGRQIGPTADVE